MYLIAGLGNPGGKYNHTRHNAGFRAIDRISERYGIPLQEKRFRGLYGRGIIEGQRVILLKPQTFMNLSGDCIGAMARYYQIPADHLIVICDDVYLDAGVLRIRKSGSAGGHNGLKDIIRKLPGGDFPRIRVGVGKQPERMDLIDHVLSRFTEEEEKALDAALEDAASAIVPILAGNIELAMNLYNGKRDQ